MTVLQRCILVVVAVLIVLAGLFVPFEYVDSDERVSFGYGWVFAPSDADAVVNTTQVFVAWIGAILVGGILWLATTPSVRKPKAGKQHAVTPAEVPDEIEPVRRGEEALTITPASVDVSSTGLRSEDNQSSIPIDGWSRVTRRDKARIFGVGFATVGVIAVGSLLLREVRGADPPPTSDDLCRFAANSVMLEQLTFADTTVDPLAAARDLFGPNAKRKWTVEQAEQMGDNINLLRQFLSENERARAATKSWLETMHGNIDSRRNQESYLRVVLFNHCTYR